MYLKPATWRNVVFCVVAKDLSISVRGLPWGYRGRGQGKGEKMGDAREKKNAQFLKIIEGRYVLWMEPLVKEKDVE